MVKEIEIKVTKDSKRIGTLAAILKSYADSPAAEKLVDNFTSRKDTTEAEIIFELVSAIYDGIAYGNWPWVKYELKYGHKPR